MCCSMADLGNENTNAHHQIGPLGWHCSVFSRMRIWASVRFYLKAAIYRVARVRAWRGIVLRPWSRQAPLQGWMDYGYEPHYRLDQNVNMFWRRFFFIVFSKNGFFQNLICHNRIEAMSLICWENAVRICCLTALSVHIDFPVSKNGMFNNGCFKIW